MVGVTDKPPDGLPEALTQFRWLRGTYLDQMAVAESVLDAYLFNYLNLPELHRPLFYGTVLSRVSLGKKVEMMCDFIDHSTLDVGDLKSRLKKAVEFRNRCAHAHLQPALAMGGVVSADRANFVGWRKGRLHEEPVTTADFHERLDEISPLLNDLLDFMCKVADTREANLGR